MSCLIYIKKIFYNYFILYFNINNYNKNIFNKIIYNFFMKYTNFNIIKIKNKYYKEIKLKITNKT